MSRRNQLASDIFGAEAVAIWAQKQAIEKACADSVDSIGPLLDLSVSTIRRRFPYQFTEALCERIEQLSVDTTLGFHELGYPHPEGSPTLREALKHRYYADTPDIAASNLCISAGSQASIHALANFLCRFPDPLRIAFFSPTYPAFPLAFANAGLPIRGSGNATQPRQLIPIPVITGLGIPDRLEDAGDLNVLYLSNPNNPTGEHLPRTIVESIVEYCASRAVLIIYDSAYSSFVQRSSRFDIFDLNRARECIVELGSFSKMASLAAARIGWMAIPQESLDSRIAEWFDITAWRRYFAEASLGVSTFSQLAAETFLAGAGTSSFEDNNRDYLLASSTLKELFSEAGYFTRGGFDCPLIWIEKQDSSDPYGSLRELADRYGMIGNPGVAYRFHRDDPIDSCRLSTMCTQDELHEAVARVKGR